MVEKKIIINNRPFTVTIERQNETIILKISNEHGFERCLKLDHCQGTCVSSDGVEVFYEIDGQRYTALVEKQLEHAWNIRLPSKIAMTADVQGDNSICPLQIPNYRAAELDKTDKLAYGFYENNQNFVKSPLAGRVIRILAQHGKYYKKGEPLLIVESMKMENEICSPCNAYVKTILIAQGDVVQQNQQMVELENKGEEDGATKSEGGQAVV